MSRDIETPNRQGRVRFESGFSGDERSHHHHLKQNDVERVLRWPRSVDELTAVSAGCNRERVTAWLASAPMAKLEQSSILVITREHRNARLIQDAWRVYHDDVDLSRVRSAREAFLAFLCRYGIDLQVGSASRRLFTSCVVPMGPTGNTEAQLPPAAKDVDVRTLQILKLLPETAQIEVSIAYAINETALRLDLERHQPQIPGIAASAGVSLRPRTVAAREWAYRHAN